MAPWLYFLLGWLAGALGSYFGYVWAQTRTIKRALRIRETLAELDRRASRAADN